MKQSSLLSCAGKVSCWAAVLLLPACGGGGGGGNPNQTKPALAKVEFGRCVDVYSYQRIDPARGDRRDRFNRKHELVARDLVINTAIETQALIDAAGSEIVDANYEFLPFDKVVGHGELLILWDSNDPAEQAKFESALANAQSGLAELAPSYRGQNTSTRPIPIMPRDAAIRLSFTGSLGVDDEFFSVFPSAVQLLEFKADPSTTNAVDAFRAVPFRLIVRDDTLILDTTILGGENTVGFSSTGLPASVDNVTANIRIALPSRGSVSPDFYIREDEVPQLNDTDSFGRDSVIRDFRSGNPADGAFASLRDSETPMFVGSLGMGITAVDAANGRIRLTKRGHQVPVRGRFPFAEGTLNAQDIPGGSAAVPTRVALRGGDLLTQFVDVALPGGGTERVRVRAEILQNQEVGTYRNDPAFPGAGRAPDGTQGEALTDIWVRVATLKGGVDSLGQPVMFTAGTTSEGADCIVRAYYYQDVRFLDGTGSVSDASRRHEYLRIDPKPPANVGGLPVPPGTLISPVASISVEFSKPIDFDRLDNTTNYVISSNVLTDTTFAGLVSDAKSMTAGVIPTRLTDQLGDGTVLQLQPPYGLFHQAMQSEQYWVHVLLGFNGVTDLAGNALSVYDDPGSPISNWSFGYTLDPALPNNLPGWHVFRFETGDEDGTLPGSIDIFGQYRLLGGRLVAAETVRFSRTADNQNLGGINRIIRGECWDATLNRLAPWPRPTLPYPPANGNYINGRLYQQPQQIDILTDPNSLPFPYNAEGGVPQPIGRVLEPHQPRGSRMMMRYLEDDFSLDYKLPTEFLLDVEQLFWSPYSDGVVQFDVFDRYTMSLAHSDRRTDLKFFMALGPPPPPPGTASLICDLDCASINSSLSGTFAENVLGGSTATTVFEDKVYRINPNEAFRSPADVKYVPYPRFDRTYTWRDSRLVNLNETGAVQGLGGARLPQASAPNDDVTADIDSPWIRDVPDAEFIAAGGVQWVVDEADFRGLRRRDHDPIALPLLVDFKVFPDGSANGIARGINTFQVAMVGMPSAFPQLAPGGYYNATSVGCANRVPWPWVRVHSTGGVDPNTGQDILVDPANELVATGGYIKDAGAVVLSGGTLVSRNLGLFQAPPGDGMLNWAQADFVRQVSTMTFGFIDTVQPNRRQVIAGAAVNNDPGVPDFLPLQATLGNLRVSDIATLMDPPISRQPAGTSVVLELRGAVDFANSGTLYNPSYTATGVTPSDVYNTRGNLLNPNYACEAYRYDQANSGAGFDTPRVDATGLTRYVTTERVGDIRDPVTGLLPRYLNLRIVMTNNVSQTPAVSPSLRSLSIVYRMAQSGN